MSMYCYQCQEAAKGIACEGTKGVCGVSSEVINLQDLAIHLLKGAAVYAVQARGLGIETKEFDNKTFALLFKTITNVSFSEQDFVDEVKMVVSLRKNISSQIISKGVKLEIVADQSLVADFKTDEEIKAVAYKTSGKIDAPNDNIRSLRALVIYGLKGLAAYQDHAYVLGYENQNIVDFTINTLVALTNDDLTLDENIALVMNTGKHAVDVMALLDKANTSTYGDPEVTEVNIGVGKNPGILISGHDLKDIEQLLKQTEGTGIDIYTHSEMLPAHYYPKLKKYSHLVGNYGNAWWEQTKEFLSFNGPILMTTNCIVPPKDSYKDKVYTTGQVRFDGVKHIKTNENGEKDFSAIIEQAKSCKAPTEIEKGKIVGGFAHNQVIALADKVVDAVKSGAVKKFVVMAGCDGRQPKREYYTKFAEQLPSDCIILTAGCAKYRYNKLELGDIGGIPRVLDAGQCNDSYSLAVIAMKLQEVFGLEDINDLPIVYNIAWYEQKAVTVLLALLYLGVKNIHLGPTLPAFLTEDVTNVLVENFGISGIATPEEDIEKLIL